MSHQLLDLDSHRSKRDHTSSTTVSNTVSDSTPGSLDPYNMAQTFTTIPVLPLSHALNPSTKPKFLEDLRSALLNVGFLYLSETTLPEQLVRDVVSECRDFFEKLPQEEKEKIEMKNEKSFLGWSRVS